MYVLEKEVLDLVPPDQDVSIEREVWPRLVGDGLYSQRLEGYWMDIGTPERYLDACWDILGRQGRDRAGREARRRGPLRLAGGDGRATAPRSAIRLLGRRRRAGRAREPTIGPRAVLGAGADVGEGATVEASALHPACRVGAGATVNGSILAAGAVVEDGAAVPSGSVIGAGATITADAGLEQGARVQPEETV